MLKSTICLISCLLGLFTGNIICDHISDDAVKQTPGNRYLEQEIELHKSTSDSPADFVVERLLGQSKSIYPSADLAAETLESTENKYSTFKLADISNEHGIAPMNMVNAAEDPNSDIEVKSMILAKSADDTDTNENKNCELHVDQKSISYFRSRLQIDKPNFIRFKLVFGDQNINWTSETFNPMNWVWTYNSTRGIYPYLHWNVDYAVLSFELLDVKTLDSDPFIFLNATDCEYLTLGTKETTELIAQQLTVLVANLSESNKITEYQESYWCFMAETPEFRNTIGYYMGLYLEYPKSIINYNCCYTFYNYSETRYDHLCLDKQIDKWVQCTIGPYILGVILFLYFPIILFKVAAWDTTGNTSTDNKTSENNEQTPLISNRSPAPEGIHYSPMEEDKWLYLDGTCPKSCMGLLGTLLPNRYPVALSRFKRLLFVLLGPSVVFIQITIYSKTMPEMTKKIIARGVPVGFLALLGNKTDRASAFVPALGGPEVLLTSYYILGIVFLVLPRNVKDVVENGIPRFSSEKSPLCLNAKEITQYSQINVANKLGFENAVNLFLCSFYMLFSGRFWKRVLEIQKRRFDYFCFNLCVCKCVAFLLLPLYIAFCIFEVLLCIVYFSVPLCSCVVLIVRGAVKTLAITIRGCIQSSNRNILSVLLRSRFVISAFSVLVAIMFIFYVYGFCMVFLQSFFFLSQIFVYCYVAVLVYPSVSFGYLFFGVIFLYYIFRLIRGFGVKYLDLLNDIVEIVVMMEEQDNYTSTIDGHLVVSNVKITRLKSIKINDTNIPVAQNILQSFQIARDDTKSKLNYKNNTYGIRKSLFDYVVRKQLPVHQQILNVVFHLSMIVLCLLITISLTAGFITGPTSEISEVMHVIFIVTVGALPRVLEVAMHDSSEHIHRDIHMRRLEDTINQYFREESGQNESSVQNVEVHQEMAHMSANYD